MCIRRVASLRGRRAPVAAANGFHPPEPTRYDFFIAHASADKPAARALTRALEALKCALFLDEKLAPGTEWPVAMPDALRDSGRSHTTRRSATAQTTRRCSRPGHPLPPHTALRPTRHLHHGQPTG